MSLDMSPDASEAASNKKRILSSKTACRGFESYCPCQKGKESFLRLFFCLCNCVEFTARGACRGVRVSGGDLCEAEAPTEPAGENESYCPCQKGKESFLRLFFCLCNCVEFTARGACRGVRVSGGHLCEAEALTEPAGESGSLVETSAK